MNTWRTKPVIGYLSCLLYIEAEFIIGIEQTQKADVGARLVLSSLKPIRLQSTDSLPRQMLKSNWRMQRPITAIVLVKITCTRNNGKERRVGAGSRLVSVIRHSPQSHGVPKKKVHMYQGENAPAGCIDMDCIMMQQRMQYTKWRKI